MSGQDNLDGQEVHDHCNGDDHEDGEDKEFHIGDDKEKEEDKVDTTMLGDHGPAIYSPLLAVDDEMQVMFMRLSLSQTVTERLVVDQGIKSPRTLASLLVTLL